MAKPELGVKRQCQACGAKFFDLNKDPIVCPKCGTVFQTLAPVRASARPVAVVRDVGEIEVDPAAAELVSLEDAEAGEKVAAVTEDDIEIEEGPADDTFLEPEEEESDDVAGLIDGDIEDDEEA